MSFKDPEGQTARWIEILGIYDFEVDHRPGRNHGNADGLSRRPCANCKQCERKEECEDHSACEESHGNESKVSSDEHRCAAAKGTGSTSVQGNREDDTWLPALTNTDLRKAQLEDPCLDSIIRLKEKNKERPPWERVSLESPTFKRYWAQWSMLVMKDGVLYRNWESERGDEITWKLVLPESLRHEVLKQLHDGPTAGHLGVKKTMERVKARFYWCGLHKDV